MIGRVVISAWKKGKSRCICGRVGCHLLGAVREDLPDDAAFEQTPERSKEHTVWGFLEKTVRGRINSQCKGPEAWLHLAQKGRDHCPVDLGKKRMGGACRTQGRAETRLSSGKSITWSEELSGLPRKKLFMLRYKNIRRKMESQWELQVPLNSKRGCLVCICNREPLRM